MSVGVEDPTRRVNVSHVVDSQGIDVINSPMGTIHMFELHAG